MDYPDYQHLFDTMTFTDEAAIIKAAEIVLKGKDRYEGVVDNTNVPWHIIGLTHYRESTCNFSRHPHEGSPLTSRTKYVPIGRPLAGNPPFTWEESAKDCYFTLKHLDKIDTWDIVTILKTLEQFNGTGYIKYHPEVLTPYLWSGTAFYTVGKYAGDGVFDKNLKDKQMGCAPIFRYLTDKTLNLV